MIPAIPFDDPRSKRAPPAPEPEDIVARPMPVAQPATSELATGSSPEIAVPGSPPADAISVGGGDEAGEDLAATESIRTDAMAPDAQAAAAKPKLVFDPPAHRGRFERDVKHQEQHYGKESAFNNHAVRSNGFGTHDRDHHVARPGVRVNNNDLFTIKADSTPRYVFKVVDGKRIAIVHDQVQRSKLSAVSPAPKGKTRLLLNPATPVSLWISDAQPSVQCVLSWSEGSSAAWIPIDMLSGNSASIITAIHADVARWGAADTPSNVTTDKMTHYVFRGDKIAFADREDEGTTTAPDIGEVNHPHVLAPGQRGGDQVGHYLTKTINGLNVISICLSLPQPDAPPVAVDVAQVGDAFFVPDGSDFKQETSVYHSGAKHSNHRQTWVFGFIGKQVTAVSSNDGKRSVHIQPDHARRGWIPLRTLRNA